LNKQFSRKQVSLALDSSNAPLSLSLLGCVLVLRRFFLHGRFPRLKRLGLHSMCRLNASSARQPQRPQRSFFDSQLGDGVALTADLRGGRVDDESRQDGQIRTARALWRSCECCLTEMNNSRDMQRYATDDRGTGQARGKIKEGGRSYTHLRVDLPQRLFVPLRAFALLQVRKLRRSRLTDPQRVV